MESIGWLGSNYRYVHKIIIHIYIGRIYVRTGGFKVNMLLLTNYYPTQSNGGTFITKRLEMVNQCGIDFDAFGVIYDQSIPLKLARTILNKPRRGSLENTDFVEVGDVRYNYIHIPIGILQASFARISARISPWRLATIRAEYLFRTIDLQKYDLIHAHCIYPEGYVACLAKNKYDLPCVLTAHGSDIHTLPYTRPELKSTILRTLESADAVVFVSNALLRKSMELGYGGENAVVIPNGVDISSFSILLKMNSKAYEFMTPTYITLFVGNLVWVKRADKLPEIFLNIKEEVLT